MSEVKTHDGGPCPVDPALPVRPIYRGPEDKTKGVRIKCARAGRLDWSHDGGPDDITGYTHFPLDGAAPSPTGGER